MQTFVSLEDNFYEMSNKNINLLSAEFTQRVLQDNIPD